MAQNVVAPKAADAESELWYGVLEAGNRDFRFAVRIAKTVNEAERASWNGTLTSLDEGEAEFALGELTRSDKKLEFSIKSTAATFTGELNSDGDGVGDVVTGRWKQRGADLELVFRKVDTLPAEELAAVWNGQIRVLFQKIDVRIRELGNGKIYFDSVTQKAGGFVATKTLEGDQVVLEVPGIAGAFTGTLNEAATELAGKWKQGLVTTELVLAKSQTATITPSPGPARPQTPVPPFPYEVVEVAFENATDSVSLAGTLLLPAGQATTAAVVLVSGSGPQDRDEALLGHKPFLVLADHFARQGIAVLRYDDRGVGQSTGDFAQATTQEFANDAEAAFAFLQSHPKIDSKKIGICGHSEGGLIAPIVAARNANVAFIMLMAGPGVNGEQISIHQTRLILQATGVEAGEIERQMKIQKTFLDLAKQDPLPADDTFMEQAAEAIDEFLTDKEREMDTGKQMVALASQQLLSPWFRYFMQYDPAPTLAKVQCPTLAINGGKDLQVDPKLNLPVIRTALESAGNQDFEIVELPDLNHLFQQCETGSVDEYESIEETINPAALKTMTDWIQAQTTD